MKKAVLFISCFFLIMEMQAQTYCTSPTMTNVNAYAIGIANFKMGSINNSTTVANSTTYQLYYDYTNQATSGIAGSTMNFSVTLGNGNSTQALIFIDWNKDGNFNQTFGSEYVWTNSNTTAGSIQSGSFVIPSVNPGFYRLRIASDLGGYTPTPCSGSYSGEFEDYTLQVFTSASYDLSPMTLVSPTAFDYCGGTSVPLAVRIVNAGSSAMTGFDVTTTLTGAMTGTYTRTNFNRSIPAYSTDTVILTTLNTTAAFGTVNFTTITSSSLDAFRADDTLRNSISFLGTPASPVFTQNPVNRCGAGPVTLSTTTVANTATFWYASNSPSAPLLSTSDTYITPPIYSPTTTYYAVKAKFSPGGVMGFAQGNSGYGGTGYNFMFDVLAGTSTVMLDSISFFNLGGASTTNYQIYYKFGTHNGYQTNASAWTLAKDVSNASIPSSGEVKLSIGGVVIPAGQTLAVYLVLSSTYGYSQNPNSSVSNGDVTVTGTASIVYNGTFGLLATNTYQWTGRLFYRKLCVSNMLGNTVNMNLTPYGADIVPDTKFQGLKNGATQYAPDIVGSRDTLVYKLTPPTGFTNAGFGSTWIISSLQFTTMGGAAPGGSDTMTTFPTSAANGTLRFSPSIPYEDSTMMLRVKLLNLSTGCDTLIVKYIYVAPKPLANFNASSLCFGTDTKFKDSTYIKAGVLSYEWEFGDPANSKSTDQYPAFMYPSAGTYNVKLKVSSHLGYSSTIQKSVTILYTPVSDFTYTNVCKGKTTNFTNTSTVGGGNSMTYKWDLGNGSTSTGTNPSFTYVNSGSYNVKLTASSGACVNSRTTTIYVFPVPTAGYSGGLACSGLSIPFANTSTIATGHLGSKWNFGDGTPISTESSPTHAYDNVGSYTVKLVSYSEFGCNDSITKTITVSAKPTAAFTAPNACIGSNVNFSNSSSISAGTLTSQWSFGDGVNQANNNASFNHSYFNVGTYNAWLVVTSDQNCKDSVKKVIEVGAMPTVNFSSNGASCAGVAMNFNDMSISSGALSYAWDFASAGSSTQQNPSFSFAAAGSYNVKLTITSTANCVNTLTKSVTVNSNPNAGFTVTKTNAQLREVQLVPNDMTLASYEWDMGDGQTFSQVSPVYRYLTNGPFTVKLTTTSQFGCSSSQTKVDSASFNVSVQNINGSSASWSVYPNPFVSAAKVECVLNKESHVQISLADATGRIVATLSSGKLSSGTHYFDIDSNGKLAKGTYWVIFEQDGNRQTSPVVKY